MTEFSDLPLEAELTSLLESHNVKNTLLVYELMIFILERQRNVSKQFSIALSQIGEKIEKLNGITRNI